MVFVPKRIERSTLFYKGFDRCEGFGLSVNRIMHKLTFPNITDTI